MLPSVSGEHSELRRFNAAWVTYTPSRFDMSCYQLDAGDSKGANPSTVNLLGAYGALDPGILINIYQSLTAYDVPRLTPYGTTSPTVAITPYTTTATWNTALQPTTVPTIPVSMDIPPA